MKPYYITEEFLQNFIRTSLAEDVGDGDHSTLACIPAEQESQARLVIKDEGILAGVELARSIFRHVSPSLQVEVILNDGAPIQKGDIAFTVKGKTQAILTAERLVLNSMQRMSGIATKTANLKRRVGNTKVDVLDTRKTTPNFRLLEKWAVLIGGGKNHRIGLYDMIMLKDNHIDAAGGIEQAILATKKYLYNTQKDLKIEIETRNLEEVATVLKTGGVDVIMLDNMSPGRLREAVQMIGGKFKTEASGGVNEENIADVAATGVDYISVGALTHAARSLDMSLKIFS